MAALCVLLLAACCFDYRKKKIPNYLIIVIAFTCLLWRFGTEGIRGAAGCVLQALAVGGILYPLYRIGAIGAGDIKLFGVTAGFLPFKKVFLFLFVSLLIAAMISLVKLFRYGNMAKRLRYLTEYLADVYQSGRWRLYLEEDADSPDIRLCLSGPVFFSLLLYLGGVF